MGDSKNPEYVISARVKNVADEGDRVIDDLEFHRLVIDLSERVR